MQSDYLEKQKTNIIIKPNKNVAPHLILNKTRFILKEYINKLIKWLLPDSNWQVVDISNYIHIHSLIFFQFFCCRK